eukprot:TRINITY_DN7501_c0_g1_i7.p1 TRINITY_DN7501_c0_g1~~TRINITY_DN7501_c0_g1_i7.p1  ORF type:complete len:131 (+),score=24.76 TRINITY_DN7501_c0_g1_i7:62-454(+)
MAKSPIFLTLGLLLIIHAAISQSGYRARLKKREMEGEEVQKIPIDILVELILGLVISLLAGAHTFGVFQSIKVLDHLKKTPQTEFDYTKKFSQGKFSLAAAVNDYLPQELTNLDPRQKNSTLARFIESTS